MTVSLVRGKYVLIRADLDGTRQLLTAGATAHDNGVIEGTLAEQGGKQMPEMFVHIAQDTPLGFPRDTASPLGRQAQAEHLAVTPLRLRSAPGRHLRLNMDLVVIVHHDIQCGKEDFEIEAHRLLLRERNDTTSTRLGRLRVCSVSNSKSKWMLWKKSTVNCSTSTLS